MAKYGTQYWATVGGEKWAAGYAQLDAILAPFSQVFRRSAAACEKGCIVDVGCGAGASTQAVRAAAPKAHITGLDVSTALVSLASSRARAVGDTRTRFVCADAARHPIEPSSIDLIVSRFGVMFFDDPVAAFAHMRGWLRPTGSMSFLVWAHPDQNPWIAEPLRALAHHLPPSQPPGPGPGPYTFWAPTRRAAVFQAAGFEIARDEVVETTIHLEGTLAERVEFYAQRGAVKTALESVSEREGARLRADLRDWVVSVSVEDRIQLPARAIHVELRPSA
ncbi:MAG: hypothetical protein CL927_11590 [Deltaproteobacteria bacterium]|nr:hypothetical protein [Deltaproteobacteria bacterium]HCH62092.1 hypothetical protein [Deltaproteobacteria bacterium]